MTAISPEALSLVLGFVVTFVTSFLKDHNWSTRTKTALCGAVSAIAAITSLVVTGDLTWANFGINLPIVFGAATAFYNLHFQNTTVNATLAQKKVL